MTATLWVLFTSGMIYSLSPLREVYDKYRFFLKYNIENVKNQIEQLEAKLNKPRFIDET